MKSIPESDWKKLRAIKDDLLNIVCTRIFEKINKIINEQSGNEHMTYLKLRKYQLCLMTSSAVMPFKN